MEILQLPPLDEDLGLEERIEALTVEALIPELAVEGLDVAVLPGTARFDEERLDANPLQPAADRTGGELGTVVGADVLGDRPSHEQLGEGGKDLGRGQPPGNDDGQAFAGVLVDDGQELE